MALPKRISPLATLTPTSNTRTWLSSPHPSAPLLTTACADHSAKIYNLQTFTQVGAATGGHKRSVRAVAWKPSTLAADKKNPPVTGGRGDEDGEDGSEGRAEAPRELTLATGSFDASAAIWKRDAARAIHGSTSTANGSPDDDDDDDWRLEVLLDGHDSEIKSLSFSPIAPLLATCGRDKSVWIWEELEEDGPGDGGAGAGESNFETVAVLQEHEGDVKCVAWHPREPLLASGSYDDGVRLWREDVDDWACCARLEGHGGTVWWVEFEGGEEGEVVGALREGGDGEGREGWREWRRRAGPRLISCSDDMSVRVWGRVPREGEGKEKGMVAGRPVPSIWKNRDFEEEWVEEARLPSPHDRPVYAVSWSGRTGRVVSAGSDGLIVVYEERWREGGDVEMRDGREGEGGRGIARTEWVVVAQTENAHDVFEINHVVWAPRADKGKRWEGEEVIVSTGDDGEVKVWTLDD